MYKQLLPLGKDILNNNKAPIKFIIKLIFKEVDTFSICGFGILLTFRACVLRMSKCVCEEDTDGKGC